MLVLCPQNIEESTFFHAQKCFTFIYKNLFIFFSTKREVHSAFCPQNEKRNCQFSAWHESSVFVFCAGKRYGLLHLTPHIMETYRFSVWNRPRNTVISTFWPTSYLGLAPQLSQITDCRLIIHWFWQTDYRLVFYSTVTKKFHSTSSWEREEMTGKSRDGLNMSNRPFTDLPASLELSSSCRSISRAGMLKPRS